jgi:RNA polymerase sigma-70 factor (ECF subfamily)
MRDDAFARHRRLLFTVAYEMLGSASDAEDVVQETWLRWAEVDHVAVREPRAYLVRIVTRQALNRLRTLARRREDYVGEWLPEPLVTSPDVAADVDAAVRQIAHRAREHVAARRPRVSVSATEQQEALDRFLAAVRRR